MWLDTSRDSLRLWGRRHGEQARRVPLREGARRPGRELVEIRFTAIERMVAATDVLEDSVFRAPDMGKASEVDPFDDRKERKVKPQEGQRERKKRVSSQFRHVRASRRATRGHPKQDLCHQKQERLLANDWRSVASRLARTGDDTWNKLPHFWNTLFQKSHARDSPPLEVAGISALRLVARPSQ